MTEKVVFEFRIWNDKNGVKYEIKQGEEKYTRSGYISPRFSPSAYTPCLKKFPALHRRFIQHSQRRVRKTLNALEKMYSDFYGNQNVAQESEPN